jgi:peptide-methionine (S)-S-oxide reductase
MAKATFAAGCFWGVEATFRQLPGVNSTRVGYTGGKTTNPTYKEVCTDQTGHAEAVEIDYDPEKVPYNRLLDVFWENHDPTQLNRQGPDWGTQYRSAIFFHSPEQETAARESKDRLQASGHYQTPIVTQVVPAVRFFEAEDYHQQYLEKRGLATCDALTTFIIVVGPNHAELRMPATPRVLDCLFPGCPAPYNTTTFDRECRPTAGR